MSLILTKQDIIDKLQEDICEVVFDTIADGTLPWEGAYELWLVYLEEVERTAGDDVNLSNVYNRGAQDTI